MKPEIIRPRALVLVNMYSARAPSSIFEKLPLPAENWKRISKARETLRVMK
jgi:hypothetical protein